MTKEEALSTIESFGCIHAGGGVYYMPRTRRGDLDLVLAVDHLTEEWDFDFRVVADDVIDHLAAAREHLTELYARIENLEQRLKKLEAPVIRTYA